MGLNCGKNLCKKEMRLEINLERLGEEDLDGEIWIFEYTV